MGISIFFALFQEPREASAVQHLWAVAGGACVSLPPKISHPAAIVGHRAVLTRHAARRAGTALHRAVPCGRAVSSRAMDQACGPRHGTWAAFPCRAAHGPRPIAPCRVSPRPVS